MIVSMGETRRAEIPNFTGGEAAAITQQGNPYVFRTSFTPSTSMPKVARYIKEPLNAKSVAIVYTNNDFGKGGRDRRARALREFKKQGLNKPIVGETTIIGQKVIELAGRRGRCARAGRSDRRCAAGHDEDVRRGLPEGIQAAQRSQRDQGLNVRLHRETITDRIGKIDSKALAAALHGACI